ncbi:MAG: bifunctional phosphopantothenoylcysteine decarboxylase/phosphopantothenate--cysteine ligase CoaBC [Desulfuromonadales bacterium]|nr:bifunctional phosphopantothenoylcysteine decarboxylase/phosphopantothenate--cysteine ligase CoaBC [Desulfuromonadales bacterium]
MYRGKQILLGVSGGIAAYKAVELLRLLVKAGADAHVVMTRHAQEFVCPLTFQTLSGNPVHSELFNLIQEREIGHIALADRAVLCIVAPATANVIGKVAHGLADDLLTTTLMASKAPVLFVPAMNVNMWENPLYRENQARLEHHGYHFMTPAVGELACGWEGQGKLPDPAAIFDFAQNLVGSRDLAGRTVLITAGPTREELDPVRYLTNYSSGKMGYAIARAARNRGARVILVSGPVALAPPEKVEMVQVTTAREMHAAVMARCEGSDVIIKAAAVADFRPLERGTGKMKKGDRKQLSLELVRNPDILADLGAKRSKALLVGFAAETDDLLANARKKLADKGVDLMVANDVTEPGAGFGRDTNIVRFLDRNGKVEELPCLPKEAVAGKLLDRIQSLLKESGGKKFRRQ